MMQLGGREHLVNKDNRLVDADSQTAEVFNYYICGVNNQTLIVISPN